jgi:hypothetical protein
MIYLLITACIQNWYGPQNAEQRKEEYLSAITETLIHVPSTIQPIIVENNGSRLTYLDEFQHNGVHVPVLYTNNNKRYVSHKGMIELFDIKDVIQEYNIKDDDMIFKLTGRYTVKSPLFFNRVLHTTQPIDAFVKFYNVCTKQYLSYDSVLGFYACKAYLLRYWSHLTMHDTSPEVAFARHIRRDTTLICEVNWLDVECNFAEENRRVIV